MRIFGESLEEHNGCSLWDGRYRYNTFCFVHPCKKVVSSPSERVSFSASFFLHFYAFFIAIKGGSRDLWESFACDILTASSEWNARNERLLLELNKRKILLLQKKKLNNLPLLVCKEQRCFAGKYAFTYNNLSSSGRHVFRSSKRTFYREKRIEIEKIKIGPYFEVQFNAFARSCFIDKY